MQNPIDSLINILFPKICIICKEPDTHQLCLQCSSELVSLASHSSECVSCSAISSCGNLCKNCQDTSQLNQIYISFNYQKSHVHRLIHAFKYQNIRSLASPLASIMSETLPYTPENTNALLIPTPIHHSRKRLRGYNQSELLARELSIKTTIPVHNALIKNRPTPTQTGLSREERLTNITGSFSLSTPIPENITKIYLIDDVTTTLSTLNEMALTLRKHTNAEIVGLALAHNQDTSQAKDLLI